MPPPKLLLPRQVDNCVGMSVQFVGYLAVRIASRGGQRRGIIVRLWGKVDQQVCLFFVKWSHMDLATILC